MSERLLPSRPATLLGRAPKAGPDPVCCYRLVKRSAYKNTNTTGRTATLCDVLRAAPAASDKVEPVPTPGRFELRAPRRKERATVTWQLDTLRRVWLEQLTPEQRAEIVETSVRDGLLPDELMLREDVPLAVEFRRRSGDVILSRGYPVSRPIPES